ncbi:hypothetical protein GSI_03000 [Ganoderma sinense ZZ0214-1]|uniref:Uncharacterized protein n=1 Tax=Ganoderma sinense ZZ0214-1 TaxID=1077348 RepID=A0A2G8SN77_9APHY|nr:hypothetical protein GSI_03000 [Ganoderma sinense ZZ0214-1]
MCSGVKVSGHPGLGKSYSLVYALLRRMSEGRPVLFSTSANSTLLIDRHGVRSMATDQVEVEHLIRVSDPYVPTSPIWSLIDASMSSQAAMSTLVHPNLFVVFASYPRAQGYMGWTEQSMAQQFIMEPWFVWELEWLLSVDGLTPLSQDQRAPYNQQRRNLEHLVHEVGPGPRDIFSYVSSPNEYKKRIRFVLKEIQGWRDVHNLFATADRTMSWEAQHLVVLRKAHVPGATDMASDLPIVCFKSRDIGLDVMRQVGYLGVEDAMEIFMKNRRWPGSRVLARWVFESLVVGIISGGGTSLNSLSDVLFQPQPSDRGPLLPRSIKSRRVAPGPGCEGVSALTLDDDLCYFPLRRDNPVFDAFYLDVTPNTVIIWLFKIQIPRKCVDGYSDAFSMVDVLLEKAKIQFGKPKVQLKYVVIAPQHGHNQPAVTLGVPERWSEFKGDVHVCYLDVAHLGCDIDDLLADLSESD